MVQDILGPAPLGNHIHFQNLVFEHTWVHANQGGRGVAVVGHGGHEQDMGRHAETPEGQRVPVQDYCHQQSREVGPQQCLKIQRSQSPTP